MNFEVGDIVKLKKTPSLRKQGVGILRVGADFRLKCTGCDIRSWCRASWWKRTPGGF